MKTLKKIFAFFIPLISEKNDAGEFKRISLGRIAFWITFGIAVYVWTLGTGDIQPSHMQMLYVTATYNLMKKTTWFGTVSTPTVKMTIEHEAEEDKAPRI